MEKSKTGGKELAWTRRKKDTTGSN
jgi:hypothetical protein